MQSIKHNFGEECQSLHEREVNQFPAQSKRRPSMVAHACNLAMPAQEVCEFGVSLGYTARPYLQKKSQLSRLTKRKPQ
jgi:hypothetical protein